MPAQVLPTVDDLLGPPSVDELLGPETPATSSAASKSDGPAASEPAGAPPQQQGFARARGLVAEAAAKGLGQGVGLPGDIETFGRKAINYLGGNVSPDPVLPTSSDTVGALRRAGLVDSPSLTPGLGEYPNLERYGTNAISALASAVPMTLVGGGVGAALGRGAQVGRMALPNALGAVAGGIAGQAASDAGAGPVVTTAAGLLGGLAGGGLAATRQVGAAARGLAGDATAADQALQAAQLAKEQGRRAGKDALDAAQQQAEAINSAADQVQAQIAVAHGGPLTPEQAGGIVQQEARNWTTNTMPEQVRQAWAPVDQLIPAEHEVPVDQLRSQLERIVGQPGSLGAASAPLTSTLAQRMLAGLRSRDEIGPVPGPPPSWQEVRVLRDRIGDLVGNPSLAKDLSQKQISSLYAAVTGDMKAAAGQVPGGEEAFNLANSESSRLHDINQNVMGKIIKDPVGSLVDPEPGKVAKQLISGGATDGRTLQVLRQELPQAADALLAAHLTPQEGGVRLGDWSKLTPGAKLALVDDPDHITALSEAQRARETADQLLAGTKQQNSVADEAARRQVFDLQQQAQAAKAALPGPSAPPGTIKTLLHSELGRALGGALIGDLGHGGGGALTGAAMGLLAPVALKGLAKGAVGLAKYPLNLTGVVAGGEASQNPLLSFTTTGTAGR